MKPGDKVQLPGRKRRYVIRRRRWNGAGLQLFIQIGKQPPTWFNAKEFENV